MIILRLILAITTFASPQVAEVALSWFKCPPVNPYKPMACTQACCIGGSNWDYTCIGFVEEVARAVNGSADPELLAGFPRYGETMGSAVFSFNAMVRANRAQYTNTPPPGAAVFFSIDGFTPGHIAIVSGYEDGALQVVTTGGGWDTGIKVVSLSVLLGQPGWHYLGWADL